jgi:hypothetical protein
MENRASMKRRSYWAVAWPYLIVWMLLQYVVKHIWNAIFADAYMQWLYSGVTIYGGWHVGYWIGRRAWRASHGARQLEEDQS